MPPSSSSSSSSTTTPHLLHDFKVLKIFSDGSTLRSPGSANSSTIVDDGSTLWKDLPFTHHLHLRLYKPTTTHHLLPILVYFHGGAFLVGSCTWPNYHNCCLRLSSLLPALLLSFDYRLAPEHPLPAALHDAAFALRWLASAAISSPDSWLNLGDFNRVYIFGDSCGGTMAHHLAVRFGGIHSAQLAPVRVAGYIMLAPFFAGSGRTRSEVECGEEEAFYTLRKHEEVLEVLVPDGEVDGSFLNPFGRIEEVVTGGEAAVIVVVGGRDLLRDRAVEYGRRLREMGKKKVEVVEFEEEEHGFFSLHPWSEAGSELIRVVAKFITNNP